MSIKAGDLVMVVRGHSCSLQLVAGVPFMVRRVDPASISMRCPQCGHRWPPEQNVEYPGFNGGAVPVSWLIKIDPPALTESVTEHEEIHA